MVAVFHTVGSWAVLFRSVNGRPGEKHIGEDDHEIEIE